MSRLRVYAYSVALTTLVLHGGALAIGALRVCWGPQPLHRDRPLDECAMHHGPGSRVGDDAHHRHGHTPGRTSDDRERVCCPCATDAAAPYVGPTGLTAPAFSLPQVAASQPIPAEGPRAAFDVLAPPPAPPPRSIVSS